MTIPAPCTATERLLVIMSFAQLSRAELAAARAAADEVSDWEELWELASTNATAPLVYANLESAGLAGRLPPEVAASFRVVSDEIRRANEARLEVSRQLFTHFNSKDVDVVILKGVLFAEDVYHNPYYKKMNDIDILVRFADLDAIFAIYEEMRLFSAAELVGGSPRKQEKFSHHAPPFFSRDLSCMVGTHWGLITPLAPYRIDYDAIWSRVRDFDFYGRRAKRMALEDNLHHLCTHLPYYKTGVRELADIYNLVRQGGAALDWELFLAEVAKAGTENLVYHALSLSNCLCPLPEVEVAIARVRPKVTGYHLRDTRRKTTSVARVLRLRSVHMSRIEKAFSELSMTHKASEKRAAWLRMWKNILLPPLEDVKKMNAIEDDGGLSLLRARLVSPLRIYRVFERDLGAKIFAAIVVKTAVDVAVESLREPFASSAAVMDFDDYATRLGIEPENFAKLKDALE